MPKNKSDAPGDASTGLYYYGARYYDPALGRFVSPDTVVPDYKIPPALNRYSYVLNNPVRYTDPTGHDWADDFEQAHGRRPKQDDLLARRFSLANPGSGPSGTWTDDDWNAYGTAINFGWSPTVG